jgi:hypothetical protein
MQRQLTRPEILSLLAVMANSAATSRDDSKPLTHQDAMQLPFTVEDARAMGGCLATWPDPRTGTKRQDAAESIFLLRELEFIKSKTYDHKYAQYRARELIPVDTSPGPGAETVVFRSYDSRGIAKIVASYADDLPRANAFGQEVRSPIKMLGTSYGYNVKEIDSAYMAGKPLQEREALAARRAFEQKLDAIAAVGDSDNGLVGLLGITNANAYTIPSGASDGADTTWATKTALEILADMSSATAYGVSVTKEVETPDTMLLPTDQFNIIANTPVTSVATTTILEFFLKSNPYIKTVQSWPKCKGAGTTGYDRMVVYRRDPDALQLVINQEFTQLPPQPTNLEYVIPCIGQTGGVVCYYPLSVTYADHI